jgi:hypothetical protein
LNQDEPRRVFPAVHRRAAGAPAAAGVHLDDDEAEADVAVAAVDVPVTKYVVFKKIYFLLLKQRPWLCHKKNT